MRRLALLLALLALAPASKATWSLTQAVASCSGTSVTNCTITTSSTGSGHLLVVAMNTNTLTTTISSLTAAFCSGSWTHATNSNASGTGDGSSDIQYCLNSASGQTSLVCTVSASGNPGCAFYEFTSSLGNIAVNTGSVPSQHVSDAACTSCAGVSLTLSGNNAVTVAVSANGDTGSGLTGTSWVNDLACPNGDCFGHALNTTGNMTAPATWTQTSSATLVASAASFEETSGGGAASGIDMRRKREQLEPISRNEKRERRTKDGTFDSVEEVAVLRRSDRVGDFRLLFDRSSEREEEASEERGLDDNGEVELRLHKLRRLQRYRDEGLRDELRLGVRSERSEYRFENFANERMFWSSTGNAARYVPGYDERTSWYWLDGNLYYGERDRQLGKRDERDGEREFAYSSVRWSYEPSGVGQSVSSPTTGTVDLTWDPVVVTDTNDDGTTFERPSLAYWIYRADVVNGVVGDFAILNPESAVYTFVLDDGTFTSGFYEDQTVEAGKAYAYEVAAVDYGGTAVSISKTIQVPTVDLTNFSISIGD